MKIEVVTVDLIGTTRSATMTHRSEISQIFRHLVRLYGGPVRLSQIRPLWHQLRQMRSGWLQSVRKG